MATKLPKTTAGKAKPKPPRGGGDDDRLVLKQNLTQTGALYTGKHFGSKRQTDKELDSGLRRKEALSDK